jgi:hypothetical protein
MPQFLRSRSAIMPLFAVSIVALAPCPGFSQVAAPAAKAPAAVATGPLRSLNVASRAAYQRAKDAAQARRGPLILAEGDNLVLLRSGQAREDVKVIPEVYHSLKAVAHIPLALDVLLASRPGDLRSADGVLDELRQYRAMIVDAEKSLGTHGFDNEQMERQKKIITESMKLLDSILQGREPTQAERIDYARRMNPLVMANVADSVRGQLDGYHRQVTAWKSRMTPEDWSRLRVIVMGMALPRKNNTAMQYFERLLGEPGEGGRVIYSESVFDEAKALDALAVRDVDTQIGIDFFNEPLRMHRDLLGDAATLYVPLLVDKP